MSHASLIDRSAWNASAFFDFNHMYFETWSVPKDNAFSKTTMKPQLSSCKVCGVTDLPEHVLHYSNWFGHIVII